jgi:N-ethylmaleimide reductase
LVRSLGADIVLDYKTQDFEKVLSGYDLATSAHLRTLWKSLYVVNGGYDGFRGEDALRTGHADAVAYARAFLANPDLPRRLQLGAALNEPDPTTFYGGDAAGYPNPQSISFDSQLHLPTPIQIDVYPAMRSWP